MTELSAEARELLEQLAWTPGNDEKTGLAWPTLSQECPCVSSPQCQLCIGPLGAYIWKHQAGCLVCEDKNRIIIRHDILERAEGVLAGIAPWTLQYQPDLDPKHPWLYDIFVRDRPTPISRGKDRHVALFRAILAASEASKRAA
jgi:hypothetical protein